MVLLIATMHGIDYDMICRIMESCGRCHRGNRLQEYRNYWDVERIKTNIKDPIVFDVVYDNFKISNKRIPNSKKLIIPCRPDIIWEKLVSIYKNPASAFFNRMTRLKEMARQPNSMVIPFERIGTNGGLNSLESFLGIGKKFLDCEWLEPPLEKDCLMIRRYNREIGKILSAPSWYEKHINTNYGI